jgi:hypothetical protein
MRELSPEGMVAGVLTLGDSYFAGSRREFNAVPQNRFAMSGIPVLTIAPASAVPDIPN